MLKYVQIALVIVAATLFTGCLPAPPYFQKVYSIPQNQWSFNYKPVFKFEITDSNAVYKPYIVLKHSEAYQFSNLWLLLYIKTPGAKVIKQERVNLTLADPAGVWMGRGLGATFEERVYVDFGDSVKLKQPGIYEISMEQNMRVNPLPEILHVGLRVEQFKKN